MARLQHIVCALSIYAVFLSVSGALHAQTAPDMQNPPARLIRPRAEPRPAERIRPRLEPVDERCRLLKEQLEGALLRSPNSHRVFQARLAHNAGTRLCREGQVERGMAEFQKGLSYFPEYHHP